MDFEDNSYGFRPGRSAYHAVLRTLEYINSGNSYIVDIDLTPHCSYFLSSQKFFT